MISQRWRYNGRGSVVMRFLTSSTVKCPAARVILAISSPFLLASSPPLFYHSTRIGMRQWKHLNILPSPVGNPVPTKRAPCHIHPSHRPEKDRLTRKCRRLGQETA